MIAARPWIVAAWIAALAGCAVTPTAPNVLVVPNPQKTPAQFQADAAGCRQQAQDQVAPQAEAANNQAAATAVAATAIGAAVGALLGSPYYTNSSAAWGAGTGLAVGSTIGAGSSQAASYGLQQRYDMVYAQCMVLLGHQLPGATVYRRPAVPPPPPATPSIPPPATPPPVGIPPPGTPPPLGIAPPTQG